jgi:hypothetical protein
MNIERPSPRATTVASRSDARSANRPRGWREGLLEIIRADATNVEYLVHWLRRRQDDEAGKNDRLRF